MHQGPPQHGRQDAAGQRHPDAQEDQGAADQLTQGQAPGGGVGHGDGTAGMAEHLEALHHRHAAHGQAEQKEGPVGTGFRAHSETPRGRARGAGRARRGTRVDA